MRKLKLLSIPLKIATTAATTTKLTLAFRAKKSERVDSIEAIDVDQQLDL